LSGAARQAGAGGRSARHRDRDDVRPLADGPSETASAPFPSFLMVVRKEILVARSVRGAALGEAAIDAQASPLGTAYVGRPATRDAPRRLHVG
jgi:hypothetical protein